ncbi:MAG: hypothetical protein AB1298_03500 [Bacteroidota bacterium]
MENKLLKKLRIVNGLSISFLSAPKEYINKAPSISPKGGEKNAWSEY